MTVFVDEATLLREAVDELTLPARTRVVQDIWETKIGKDGRPVLDGNGEPLRVLTGRTHVVHAEAPPLLQQLAEAIGATIGRSGGGGVEKHARNVLDSDALYQASIIMATITDWCTSVGVRASREPVKDLRAWHAARLATNPESDILPTQQLRRWSGMIRAKLNRPESWEVKDPCPICHYTTWEDETEEGKIVERNRPILVEYWPSATDVLASGTATCRRCGAQWKGSTALRELRWEIDQAEKRRHADAETS